MNYQGNEKGSTMINLKIDEAIIYDGLHYDKLTIPYMKEYDTKSKNVPIFISKKAFQKKSVTKNVPKRS